MERTHLATEAAVGALLEHFECVPLIVDTSDESLGGLHETGSSPAATKTWFSPGRIL